MTAEDRARTRGMRVHLDVTVAKPARRGERWSVEAGPWRGEGVNEKAAVDALAERLGTFCWTTASRWCCRFADAVLGLDLGGDVHPMRCSEQVIGPDGRVRHSGVSENSWQYARSRTCFELAWRATDCHDDASVHEAAAYLRRQKAAISGRYGPDELYRDAARRRAAQAAIAAGREDWHEWAGRHSRDLAVPPARAEQPGQPPA